MLIIARRNDSPSAPETAGQRKVDPGAAASSATDAEGEI